MSHKGTLKRELERLVIHANDSVKGYAKGGEKLEKIDFGLSAHFASEAGARQAYVDGLNSRLLCIGEDEKERGSLEGGTHRALISLKDVFTSSDDAESIIEEAIRGEEKLLSYIEDTFDDIDVMDGATQEAIAALRGHVESSLQKLNTKAKAA